MIELIVVLALLGIFLGLTIPGFRNAVLIDDARQNCRFIIGMAHKLRNRAEATGMRHVLNISVADQKIWETWESMTEEEKMDAESRARFISGDVRVVDVERPKKGVVMADPVRVNFYPRGYSDMVFIHLRNSKREDMSILIEPFLPEVKLYEKHMAFE